MNDVMKVVKQRNLEITRREFDNTCLLSFALPLDETEALAAALPEGVSIC